MGITTAITEKVETVVMAGGRGERLYPLTATRPKPAVPFGGVFRIVDFTLSNCLNSGLRRVALLTQYRHEELQTYIQQSWNGLWTEMRREPLWCLPPNGGNRYRGTADAVFQNIGGLRDRRFVLILSGDHVYHMDYRALLRSHADTDADLTIATVERPLKDAAQFGVVEVGDEQRVIGFQEKPSIPRPMPSRPAAARISMGVYVFKREVLIQALSDGCGRKNGYDFGHHIIPSLIGSSHVQAYDFRDEAADAPGYWRDIGTLDHYYEASMDLARPDAPFDPYANDDWPSYPARYLNYSSAPGGPLRANRSVTRSIISPGVRIEDGGWIDSSVLMPGVSVGKGARIRHAIIEEGVYVPAGCQIGFDLENDRKRYFTTGAGVIVVSHTPKPVPPAGLCVARQVVPRPGIAPGAAEVFSSEEMDHG